MAEVAASVNHRVSPAFPDPPVPGLAGKMTPRQLLPLMSTRAKGRPTQSRSRGAWDREPPPAPSREAGLMGPGPRAPRRRRLQTFPNSRPTCHGGRAGQLSGAPGRLPGPPAAGAPPLPAGRRTHRRARTAWASPIFRPATRSPRGAPPASAPRSCGPAPAPGWARASVSTARGSPDG